MAMMDQFHNISAAIAIPNDLQVESITLDEAITVDTQGYESVTFLVFIDDDPGTGDFEITVYESDTIVDDDFVQVENYPASSPLIVRLLGVIDLGANKGYGVRFLGETTDRKLIKFAYIGQKQYLRLVLTASDTPSLQFGVVAILGNPLQAPTPDEIE